jgi:hypothetical protein
METFLLGNTMKMSSEFKDWESGELMTDPTVVKLIILDLKFNELETIILGPQNRLSKGKYFCFYIPKAEGHFYYEWNADIDGLPSLTRGSFRIKRIMEG